MGLTTDIKAIINPLIHSDHHRSKLAQQVSMSMILSSLSNSADKHVSLTTQSITQIRHCDWNRIPATVTI